MLNVKIFGAGSIGNHLAHGCRNKGWNVTILDIDPAAVARCRDDIYPSRYGKWDSAIKIGLVSDKVVNTNESGRDLVILGTPPDTHLNLAFEILESAPPKVLLIEKPLCTPDLSQCDKLLKLAREKGTAILTAYNHCLTEHTQVADQWLNTKNFGKTQTLVAQFREYWGGIFKAHPWLAGPHETYLGFSSRGGGASGEHSHAINIWQHFAHRLGAGRITEVSAMLDWVKDGKCDYDSICQLSVRTERGLAGFIVQDVVTEPSLKQVRIQFEKGYLEWTVNAEPNLDLTKGLASGETLEHRVPKKRPDDFKGEIDHIEQVILGKADGRTSPISLDRGLETMLVVAAAHLSSEKKRVVKIDYAKGYSQQALSLV